MHIHQQAATKYIPFKYLDLEFFLCVLFIEININSFVDKTAQNVTSVKVCEANCQNETKEQRLSVSENGLFIFVGWNSNTLHIKKRRK